LLENATQAAAGDVMREGMLAAEAEGYEPFMLVHDEMLATKQPGQTHERLCELLCTMPAWAKGLPLAAEGSTIPFYKK
jgi:DNA polymerase